MSLESDLECRRKDAFFDVEIFRLVHGRLPNKKGDEVTKMTAKLYLDKYFYGGAKVEGMISKEQMNSFAFNTYASTNLAYKNDLKPLTTDKG